MYLNVMSLTGEGASMEDRSEAASDDLQAADCWHHRGENLPQVRVQFDVFYL